MPALIISRIRSKGMGQGRQGGRGNSRARLLRGKQFRACYHWEQLVPAHRSCTLHHINVNVGHCLTFMLSFAATPEWVADVAQLKTFAQVGDLIPAL